MKKLLAALIAGSFAFAGTAIAQAKEEMKKPTVDECKKDPKIKGCDEVMKAQKK